MVVSEAGWLVEVVRTQPAHGEPRHEVEDHVDILEEAVVVIL
jgi:hypothetical protein